MIDQNSTCYKKEKSKLFDLYASGLGYFNNKPNLDVYWFDQLPLFIENRMQKTETNQFLTFLIKYLKHELLPSTVHELFSH